METSQTLLIISIVSFLGILFMPIDSDVWRILFLVGCVFGVLWFIKK